MANALGGVLLAGMAPFLTLAVIGFLLSVPLFAYQPIMVTSQFDTKNLAQSSQATIVSADANGAFVAGYTNLTGTAGRYFIGHVDQIGRLQWTHSVGMEGDSVGSISAGGTGVYVVGTVNNSPVLAQFDSNGNQVWSRPLGIANGYVSSVNGNAFVAGNDSMIGFDSTGNMLKAPTSLGLSGTVTAASAVPSGLYVLTSERVLAKLSLAGSVLWSAPLVSCSSVGAIDAKPSLALANGMEFVDYSSCLMRYDSNGRLIGDTPITCADQSTGQQSWTSADSASVYAVMSSNGGPNCLTRYDFSGNQVSGFYLSPAWRIRSISTGNGATYVAGATGSVVESTVLLARLGFSNDLILLGLHSPFSLLLIALVVGLVCLGVFRYRRRRRSHLNKALLKDYRFDGPVDGVPND